MKIELDNCSLELDENGVVELHILPSQILEPAHIRALFDVIHSKMPKARYLLVTAGNKASLNQEARDLVSTQDITNQIVADAVVTEHYGHQMSANFFVRHNHPHRPTKLFKSEAEARAWLLTQ